ncbi:MAG TPA: O-antigen ligase family protein [Thermoleophilaceae bacterium]
MALLASPAVLAFDRGGSGASAQALGAVLAFGLLGVCAVLAPWPLVERAWPLRALLALLAFAGWTALSAAWSPALGDAVNDADRLGFYAGVFFLAVVAMSDPRARALAPDVLLWGIAVVALYALAGRLLPDLVEVARSGAAGDRLDQPLTYWNAMGAFTGFGALLATAVAAGERRPLAYRAAACAAGVPCALACYLTFSRASWAAVGAGLAVLSLLRPRVATLTAAGLWLLATALLAGLLRAFPAALHLDRGAAAQASDGPPVALAALLLAALAAAAFARVVRGRAAGALPPRRAGPLAVGAVALVLAAGVGVSFVAERSEDIGTGAARVTTLKTYRGDYWRVALGSFAGHPAAGTGTAGFRVEWIRERDSRVFAADAHSLYFETLAELGLVGAVLLAALVAAVTGGLRRLWRVAPEDPLLPAAAAVLGAFAVHAGLDWDWEMPSVALVALLLAAAAVQRPAAPAPR